MDTDRSETRYGYHFFSLFRTHKKEQKSGMKFLLLFICRRPGSNRHGYHYPRDFKSRASANSATAAKKIWGLQGSNL